MDRRTAKKLYPNTAATSQARAIRAIALDLYNRGMPAAKAAAYAPDLYSLAAVAAADNAEKVVRHMGLPSMHKYGGHADHVMAIYAEPQHFTEHVRRALHSFADRA